MRKKLPTRRPEPRQVRPIKERQELFARHYAVTLDPDEALEVAGYKLASDDAKRSAKSKLLRNPSVTALIDEIQAEGLKKYKITAEGTVARLHHVYLEAMAEKDFTGAVSALREVAKLAGYYLEHNRQKKYTEADAERLKKDLEMVGFNFKRVNYVGGN